MNTANKIGICNMALSSIGVSRTIQDIGEDSLQARTCNLFWQPVVEQVLQAFPWDFAMKYERLQIIDKHVPKWIYVYDYPADCLQARIILPHQHHHRSDDISIAPGYQDVFSCGEFWYWWNSNQRIPFEIVTNDPNGLAIGTNLNHAHLAYTARIELIPLWSPAFVNALSWLLASKIVAPLSAQPAYAKTAGAAYQAALLEAGALSLNEGKEKSEPMSEFIEARF